MTRTYAEGIEDAARVAETVDRDTMAEDFLAERIAAAIRTLSPSPSGIEGAREALTKAAEAFREEIERERFFSAPPREALYRELAEMCESASSKIGGDHG